MVTNSAVSEPTGDWVRCGGPDCSEPVHRDVGYDDRIVVSEQTTTADRRTLYCSRECAGRDLLDTGGESS